MMQRSLTQPPGDRMLAAIAITIVIGWAPSAVAQPDTVAQPASPSVTDEEAAPSADDRLRLMQRIAEQITVSTQSGRELTISQQPLLRYSNPVRNSLSDGCTYLWYGSEGVPLAATTLSIRGTVDGPRAFLEVSSLGDVPLELQLDAETLWKPAGEGHVEQPLFHVPPVPKSPALRLVQMRRLAGRFHVSVEKSADDVLDLRLLSQPIARYQPMTGDVVDGALFAYSEATDPEAILVVEAVRSSSPGSESGSETVWRYSLAKMTSLPTQFELDGSVVWEAPGYWGNPKSIEDRYKELPLGELAQFTDEN